MSPTDRRPSVSAPRTPLSIAPILSIFTLRPKAHTIKPAELQPTPSRLRRPILVGLIAVASLGLLGWYVAKPPTRQHELPAVFINGAPKEKQTSDGKPERWANAALTVKIDASVNLLGPGALSAVQAGFGAWLDADATLPSLTLDTTAGLVPKLQPDGTNAVVYAPIEIPGHKKDLALTISFVDATTGRILESDIVINAKKHFDLLGTEHQGPQPQGVDDDDGEDANEIPNCGGAYDLQSVVTHEAGHFFGLGEDLEDTATTMFFKTGKCEIRKRDLEVPDRTVMTRLYDQPAPPGDEPADTGGGCGGASIAHGAKSRGLLAFALAFALIGWARRRVPPLGLGPVLERESTRASSRRALRARAAAGRPA